MSKRLQHDVAYAFACQVIEQVGYRFNVDERPGLFDLLYRGAKAAMEAYHDHLGRHERRMRSVPPASDN